MLLRKLLVSVKNVRAQNISICEKFLILILGIVYFVAFIIYQIVAKGQNDINLLYFSTLFSILYIVFYFLIKQGIQNNKRFFFNVIFITFFLIAAVAIFTYPVRSNDIYWNLLITRGFTYYHLNPFQITPNSIPLDPLYKLAGWWTTQMTHGPVWIYILSIVTFITKSAYWSIVLLKILWLCVLAICGCVFWKIMGIHKITENNKYIIISLLVWNPYIIQEVLVDLHADIFVMLLMLLSYFFVLQKKNILSVCFLIIGGFFKFSTFFLLPVPIFYILLKHEKWQYKVYKITLALVIFISVGLLLYAPFGYSFSNLDGFINQVNNFDAVGTYLPGTFLITHWFHPDRFALRFVGLMAAFASIAWYLRKDKLVLTYTVPYLIIFFFTTIWFQPWYVLWIFPLLFLYLPMGLLIALTAYLMVTYSLVSSVAFVIILTIYLLLIIVKSLALRLFTYRI